MKTGKFSRRSVLFGGVSACVFPRTLPAQDRELEGGIGGTGIVGLLTDFGSLIVGGRYVATDETTQYSDAFGPLSKSDLAVGDSLTVEAAGPENALVARRVQVTHPLVGHISDLVGSTMIVNGVSVQIPEGSRNFRLGDRVAVSGLWRGETVVASRVSGARSTRDLISGDFFRFGRGPQVGGIAVRSTRLAGQSDSSFATAIGSFDSRSMRLNAETVQSERFLEAAGPLRSLVVEGFLETAPEAPGYRVSGLGHSFARNLDLRSFAGARTLFSGPYDGRFAANEALTLPEGVAERRSLLKSVALRR